MANLTCCNPGSRQDDVSLLLQACLDALLIRDMQGHEFFIALHQIGHTAPRNTNATCLKRPMHLRNTPMFPEAPLTNQRNHLQAKLAVWQREASLPPLVGRADGNADNLAEPDFSTTKVNLHRPESVKTVRWL